MPGPPEARATTAPPDDRERERLGRAILESAVTQITEPVMITRAHSDPFGAEIVFVNPAFCAMTGYAAEELLGATPREIKGPPTSPALAARFRADLAAGRPFRAEVVRYRKDGGEIPLDWRVGPVRNQAGEVTHFVWLLIDVTESRRAERALLEAKDAAERTSRAKSEFLANMSHELRTPLNSIIGFSEILADGDFGALNERQTLYLNTVLTSGRHLMELINDMLDLAKIEAEGADLEPAEFDLASLVLDLVPTMAPTAEREGICLAVDLAEGMPVVRADPRRIKQVIYNLLSNALRFTPRHGRVTVQARWLPAEESGTAAASRFRIAVADTGLGIRPEHQGRLFQVFEQVDSSYTRTQRGTGLGLALCRRLVEMHGGRIWLESAGEGKGSTFFFEIPERMA